MHGGKRERRGAAVARESKVMNTKVIVPPRTLGASGFMVLYAMTPSLLQRRPKAM